MMVDIAELIKQPQQLDRETLYELRATLALYPYFQTVRLLLLQNLYLLHDPSFDEELRRAAIYITDRKVIFRMVEAGHYELKQQRKESNASADTVDSLNTDHAAADSAASSRHSESRTLSLIENFLESLPKEELEQPVAKPRRKPTPADAAVDYVAYLLECESEDTDSAEDTTPQLRGQTLIDNFINSDKGKIQLTENPTLKPDLSDSPSQTPDAPEMSFGTETLARIYIKQGRYSQALEIIRRLSLDNPKKNAYFADQIRFLQKLIINNNKK